LRKIEQLVAGKAADGVRLKADGKTDEIDGDVRKTIASIKARREIRRRGCVLRCGRSRTRAWPAKALNFVFNFDQTPRATPV
jgi:hypothetical protein